MSQKLIIQKQIRIIVDVTGIFGALRLSLYFSLFLSLRSGLPKTPHTHVGTQ